MSGYSLVHRADDVNSGELAQLYRVAPLGSKSPEALATVFGGGRATVAARVPGLTRKFR